MPSRVGVVAIQGDFQKHVESLQRAGIAPSQISLLRTADDLEGVGRAIIPGGESTTTGLLMQRFGLGDALKERAQGGMPLWGTCMGMILMAREVCEREQYTLGVLDIAVVRNAFGAQVHSFEAPVQFKGFDEPVTGVFIRAPVATEPGPGVEILAEVEGQVVAVREGNRIGTSFHPELTDSTVLHEWFLKL